jgi:hypothetical protein
MANARAEPKVVAIATTSFVVDEGGAPNSETSLGDFRLPL